MGWFCGFDLGLGLDFVCFLGWVYGGFIFDGCFVDCVWIALLVVWDGYLGFLGAR